MSTHNSNTVIELKLGAKYYVRNGEKYLKIFQAGKWTHAHQRISVQDITECKRILQALEIPFQYEFYEYDNSGNIKGAFFFSRKD